MNQGGYTVLEALVAFAILSVVLVAFFAAGENALHAVDAGSRTHRAELLMQSKLDEIAAIRDPLPATSRGAFAGTDVGWQMEAVDLPTGYAGANAFRVQDVHLTLSWPRDDRLQTATIETRHLGIVRR